MARQLLHGSGAASYALLPLLRHPLEHVAAQLGGMAGCQHERLLVGPEEEDRRSQRTGTPTAEVARTFGVGLSTVKRYAATAREGKPLAPKKRPGSNRSSTKRRGSCWKRTSKSALRRRSRKGASSGACGGSTGERFHRLADARAYRMEPKKRLRVLRPWCSRRLALAV